MYTLMNGDCLELIKRIDDESIDLIITDPPYKLTKRGSPSTAGGMFRKRCVNSGMVFNNNEIEIEDWLPELYRVLKNNSHCYIMTNNKNITHYLSVIEKSMFHFIKCLIWVKDNKIMGQTYMSQFEYVIMLRKGKHKRINDCGQSDVIFAKNKKQKDENGKTIHDTEKPVELIEILVKNSSNENDLVFDPFMGINSTGIACYKNNRRFIGIEIDKKYFEFSKKRIESIESCSEQLSFDNLPKMC